MSLIIIRYIKKPLFLSKGGFYFNQRTAIIRVSDQQLRELFRCRLSRTS